MTDIDVFEQDPLDTMQAAKAAALAPKDDQWHACCSKTEVTFVKFMVQVSLGFSVILFSMVQIMRGVENDTIYFTLISAVFGVFIPHPTMTAPPMNTVPYVSSMVPSSPPSRTHSRKSSFTRSQPLPPLPPGSPVTSPERARFPRAL